MAYGNFQINFYQQSNTVHLNLEGVFDGSSALQLLYLMRKHYSDAATIYIHTESLSRIETFGLNMFRQSLGNLKSQLSRFTFTGEKALFLLEGKPTETYPEKKDETGNIPVQAYYY